MIYLLDTDVCSTIVKRPDLIKKRLERTRAGDIAISAITWAELNSWIATSADPERRFKSLQKMFAAVMVLSFTAQDAEFHGAIFHHLKQKGQIIGALDFLIAAQAVARELTLVTNNTRHFSRVPRLKLENWLDE